MKNGTIKIDGKAYPYAFKMKHRRLFMQKQGLEFFDEYAKQIEKIQPDPKKGMSVEGLYIFIDLLITAIQSVYDKKLPFDEDGLADLIEEQPQIIEQITADFVKAQEHDRKKPNPSSSGGKSKKAG